MMIYYETVSANMILFQFYETLPSNQAAKKKQKTEKTKQAKCFRYDYTDKHYKEHGKCLWHQRYFTEACDLKNARDLSANVRENHNTIVPRRGVILN